MTLFELAATLSLDTTNFNRSIRQASDTGQNFANTLSQNVTAKAVALGNALYKAAETGARALINLGKSAVTAAAEVSAENAQFEAAFGDIQKAAHNVFNAIGRDTNILATRLRGVGTKAFSQFKGAGLEAADALAMTDKYTRIAADAAAYYDISLEAADERLRSFLRGNTEAGDAIGLFTSESQRNAYAMERYSKKWQDLTEAQKQMLMLNVAEDIYAQSGAIGQAEREGSNWANTVANLNEIWRQTLALLGKPFTNTLTPFLEDITAKLGDEQLQAGIASVAEKLGQIAGTSLTEVSAALDTLLTGRVHENSSLSSFIAGLQEMSAWATEKFPFIKEALAALALAVAATNAPFLVLAGLVALVALNWNTLTAAAESAKEAVKEFFEQKISPALQTAVSNIAAAWNGVASAVSNAISRVRAFANLSVGGGKTAGADVREAVTEATGSDFAGALSETIVQNSTVNPDNPFGNAVQSFFDLFKPKAVGLDYVPYNDYLARLHEGEAVLTKTEATAWRRGEGQGVDVAGIVGAVVQGVREGLRGLAINMDGHAVGDLVTEQVSRNIAQAAWAGRYSG